MIFLLIVTFGSVIVIKYNHLKKIRLEEISQYLAEHYSEEMIIEDVVVVDNNALCYWADKSDLIFNVLFWVNQNRYMDTYLENCLIDEAEKLIQKQLEDRYSDVKCYISTVGPPLEQYDRLYDFYKQSGRPLSWYDEECNEKVFYMTVKVNSDLLDENDANEIINSIKELPIHFGKGCIIVEDVGGNEILRINNN